MKTLAVIDCETDPFKFGRKPEPFIWGFFDGESFQLFPDALNLIEFLKHREFIVYAHNGGKFDFMFMLEHLEPGNIKIINGRLAEFKIGKTTFRDSWLIYPQALKTSGEKREIDYSMMEKGKRDANMSEIVEYLKWDCIALYNTVKHFRENYGKGLTIAGTAMKIWSKMSGIDIPRTSRSYFDRISPFYFGGRVEAFRKGVQHDLKDYSTIDIVSAFPKAMTIPQPWGASPIGYSVETPKLDILRDCMCHFESNSWGAFPIRNPKGGISFPHDGKRREFWCSGHEVFEAIAHEDPKLFDIRWIEYLQFTQMITFDEYVGHFFAAKAASPKNSAVREINKLFLNGLYGKFSANPENYLKYSLVPIGERPDIENGWCLVGRAYPWDIHARDLSDEEGWRYDLATGSGITGFQRGRLYRRLCNEFGFNFWENSRLFYVDTDCIKGESLKNVDEGKALGQWEREKCDHCGSTFRKSVAFAGKKLYSEICFCGASKNRSKGVQLSSDQIFAVASGQMVTAQRDAPTMSIRGGVNFLERDIRMT